MSLRPLTFIVAVLLSVGSLGASAASTEAGGAAGPPLGTDCPFGGPTPGWQAIRLDLSQSGSSFLTLELGAARATRPINDDNNWHLAEGIFVVNEDTLELEAYRISSHGMAPRRAMLRTDGATHVNEALSAPEVPYAHHRARLREGLPRGRYLVLAFGVDGGSRTLNEWWSAGVQVEGKHRCASVGRGETFEFDQSDFTGGTTAYVPGAGYAQGVEHAFTASRSLVIGLIDAETQARAGSSATLDYTMPTGSGTVTQNLIPFVSTAGVHSFKGSFSGVYPVLVVAGLAFDLT